MLGRGGGGGDEERREPVVYRSNNDLYGNHLYPSELRPKLEKEKAVDICLILYPYTKMSN